MSVPTHSVKHVRNKYRKLQLLAAFFATLTIAAAFLAAASGLQATLLKKKQLQSKAKVSSSEIHEENESSQQIDSLNSQLSAEKSTTQALRQKVTHLERRLDAIQKSAKKTQPSPDTIPVPKQFPPLEKAKPNKQMSPAKSTPLTIKPSTPPPVQPKPIPKATPEPAKAPKSIPAVKPEPAPAPKPLEATPKPVAEPKADPAPNPEPVTAPIPVPVPVPETPEVKTLPEGSSQPVSPPVAPPKPVAATPQSIDPDGVDSPQTPGEQTLMTEEISSEEAKVQP